MDNCRVSQEELQHDRDVMALESKPHIVKCLECEEVKPANEMRHIMDHFDNEGCCDDCALDEDIKIKWGFE